MLAVPSTTGWGIITAENLLSSVVKNCYGNEVVVAHRKNICDRQKKNERSQFNLKALLEPAMVGQDDTELDKFLDSFEGISWLRENKVCLIIDRQGELQGRLDRSKIIEYLAQTTPTRNKVISPPVSKSSLEEIALPVKIETANGRVVCANRQWQDLFTNSPSRVSKRASASEASMDEMTQWSFDRQQGNRTHRKDFQVNNSNDLSSFGIEITRAADWNYLKIPLIGKLQRAKDLQYLVLATAISKSEETELEQIAVASPISSDRILTMASHELKSPLTGILGLSSLLEEQKIGSLNQRQMQYVKLIYCSGKKMMGIVDSLLQLNALTGDSSQSTELINLEFLCRQLYREILTKLRSTEEHCLALEIDPFQLNIELGSEIAIANKPLLSAVLSHLLTETIKSGDFEPPKIEIKSQKDLTAIEIINQNTPIDLGLNWMIAECLSRALQGRITYACDPNSSKISLFLPENKTEIKPYYSLPAVATEPQHSSAANANLTILCLYPELDVIDPHRELGHNSNFDVKSWSDEYERQTSHQHRIIEADSLEQAHNLARIWRLDAIVLNGYQIAIPDFYLRSLQEYEHLASLPLITLDARTTEAANRIEGLKVYPCLLPAQQCNIEDLVQVIKIAIET